MHNSSLGFVTYQVTIQLNILGALMEHRIKGYVEGGLIVTKQSNSLRMINLQVLQQV